MLDLNRLACDVGRLRCTYDGANPIFRVSRVADASWLKSRQTTKRAISSHRDDHRRTSRDRTVRAALDQSCAAVTIKDRASREFIADKKQHGLSNITRCTNATDRNTRC